MASFESSSFGALGSPYVRPPAFLFFAIAAILVDGDVNVVARGCAGTFRKSHCANFRFRRPIAVGQPRQPPAGISFLRLGMLEERDDAL